MLSEIMAMTTQSEIRTKSYEVIVQNNESVVNELIHTQKLKEPNCQARKKVLLRLTNGQ